jgi:opacity protein-like surface antigen
MKFILTALSAAILSTNVAFAEDAPNASWVGPYAGFSFGHTSIDAQLEFASTSGWWTFGRSGGGNFSPSQKEIGFQLGSNYALGTDIVSGFEMSFAPSKIDQTIVSPLWPAVDSWNVGVEDVFSLSARLGRVSGNRLLYVTSGLTSAKVSSHLYSTDGGSFHDRSSESQIGYMIGAGIEFEVDEKAVFAIEYKYSDFGSAQHAYDTTCPVCGTGDERTIDVTAKTLALKFNRRF